MSEKFRKKFKILEFGDYIWNHYEKCIVISTNMPCIGAEMCEISRMWRKKAMVFYIDGETNGRVQRNKWKYQQ